MRKILLASHGRLADGLKSSLEIFLGDCKNIETVCAYVEEGSEFVDQMQTFINTHENDGDTIIFTDIYGGSVNTKMVELMAQSGKSIPIVAGMNLPLVLSIALCKEPLTSESIQKCFDECKFVLDELPVKSNHGSGENSNDDFLS